MEGEAVERPTIGDLFPERDKLVRCPVYFGDRLIAMAVLSDEQMIIQVGLPQLTQEIKSLTETSSIKGIHLGLQYVPAKPLRATAGVKHVEDEERHP